VISGHRGTLSGRIERRRIRFGATHNCVAAVSCCILLALFGHVLSASQGAAQASQGTAQASDPISLSVPAEFVRELTLPGMMDHFLRPSAIYIDPHFHEVFIADPGHNRIVVLDADGTYRFEFPGADRFASPLDVDVDSEGYIYVLGSTSGGRRLFWFDFDGAYLGEIPIQPVNEEDRHDIRSVAVGDDDTLYLLDVEGDQVLSCTREGNPKPLVRLLQNLDEEIRLEQTFGTLRTRANRIYVPVPTIGSIYVYSTEGEFVRMIGRKGSNVGTLNFPVDIAVTADGLILVLDKNRFNVGCFDSKGKFLGEFGGKGARHGWFYHPSLLAVDQDNLVYVGQVFKNMVQICRIPEFIAGDRQHGTIEKEVGTSLAGIPSSN
jgi:DNA-binding beta-propeller fold protein YncE